ncbi:MAG: cytochrome d ubiquinol oxidase subunit II [Ignavibacteria bacterium]|jgi:cytochrome d ubiquinol oxidase subunit II|nr:cytochrome d ubiquinol oxidase subunit II [Ignavibacteria bacterium]MCU7505036.1 cytochrome d ubiquinol oxidase subunit II [Ignavibacteria bacterium]MCU7515324.1 cytochrome d ubiquinol oxidase subunit II [Ignavibacteria bacterium]
MDLNIVWFLLIGALISGYAVLDGFDLGIGALHLFTKTDEERRVMLNSIGPVWDGNEVWLVTSGGALFAAFPEAYATVFSGFYTAFMLLLFALIFRAVAIEFRSKEPMKWWRRMWDVAFSAASIFIALLMGVALGNIAFGIPLAPTKEFTGNFFTLLNPFSILVGITTVALFMMHGAIYGVMKTEGAMHEKIRGWVNNTIIFFVVTYVTTTMATLIYLPHMADHFKANPYLFIVAIMNMLAIANIPREIFHRRDFNAFLSSSASILLLLILFAIGIFPNMVISNPNAANSLTIYNAASSQKTLMIMLIVAIIGLPFVMGYTASIHWIFRGKVKLNKTSY